MLKLKNHDCFPSLIDEKGKLDSICSGNKNQEKFSYPIKIIVCVSVCQSFCPPLVTSDSLDGFE